jgi:A/G-specific adenine glycosylase
MLQQTRVDQGMPYYYAFVENYPTVFELAKASESDVLKLWQGLGYYSRARNLHATAKYVANELNGVFPDSFEGLLKLKGVGHYTASAIASICYGEAQAVVDGNVFRVLSRYFDLATPINSTKGLKEFRELAFQVMDKKDPATFNQAIMEFGAVQCKPSSPDCTVCPLNKSCLALKNNRVALLPVKIKKKKVTNRYFNYLVFSSDNNETLLQQRTTKGIWQNLFEFPLIETLDIMSREELIKHPVFIELTTNKAFELHLFNTTDIVHKLSHQHLHTKFWIVQSENTPGKGVPSSELKDYAVPVLIDNFLADFNFDL